MCGSYIEAARFAAVEASIKSFGKFLQSMFKIGCIGFGGGSALIPVIEREIVDKQKLDEKKNIDKDVVVASITPGALPVEIAASIGRRAFGIKGMVAGAVIFALPVFRIIRKWIRPIISGLLMKIMIMLCGQSMQIIITFF